ncbi:amino acid ABC transporter permease [Breznakia pachnodae]|uniref:Polar amino acid transport system permease protein n=1 Tax=Breznakia pachnodae TaxID=265178 RepID=A0ABU0E163_9FIRM|nr:amino acid ABC transporter permease [Breznakia pachnodae]MDQ0360456.1 polar amino acid transport system permease protein [Breznakia pachnodae]
MDWKFINEYWPIYVEAAKLTITVGSIGIAFAFITGIICSFIQYYKVVFVSRVVTIYIELSRNTPLLIQLFLLYYGLPKIGILLDSQSCAIVGLTFLGGSYMAESIRSGLEAIPKTQIETARSVGMTKLDIFRYVIFPQAIEIALPSIAGNTVFLLKETSVFSIIALPDLVYVAKDLIGISYNTDEALLLLVISYLVLIGIVSLIFMIVEKKVRYGSFGS